MGVLPEAGEWRQQGLYRNTWIVFANPMSVPQTATLTVRWDGHAARTVTRDMAVGGRAAVNLEETVPGPGNWNGTVEIACRPGWCAEVVSIYADTLKRGTVASHPTVKWGCR